jgi:hypothetical protein
LLELRPSARASIYLVGLIPGLLAAQDPGGLAVATDPRPPAARYTVTRAAGPIRIDGQLDDAGWQGAPEIPIDNEVSPGDNVPAKIKAFCRLSYDRENLYLGCRAFDPDPKGIRAHVVDRDNVIRLAQDDLMGAYIDPFNDQRRAFAFIVNPRGVQAEGVRQLGRMGEDFSWDAIWTSQGRITDDGWIMEAAIPFKSLRFPHTAGVQTWGFTFLRAWPRNNRYRMTSVRLDRANSCDLCQANKITGFEGISSGQNVQITPTLTGGRTDVRQSFPSGPLTKGTVDGDVGVDLLLGITPNVSLNATVNPDFSQVEADVAQLDVNRRFALSYPEKRPFFLEGADFFGSPIQAVFTRTIADPQVGAKISGKIGASTRNTIGLFSVRDRLTLLQFPSNQLTTGTSLEQEAWTAAGRFRRDLGQSSNLGLLYTGRAGTGYANQVGGIDFFQQLNASTRLTGQYLASVTEYPDSVAASFGQPRGSFTGGAAQLELSHDTGRWHALASYLDLSPEFRADMGFVPRVDVRTFRAEVSPVWYRPRGWFTMLSIGPTLSRTQDHDGVLTDQDLGIGVSYQGPWQSYGFVSVVDHRERFEGVGYRFRRMSGYLDAKPRGGLSVTLNWQVGGGIDYANGRQAAETILTPSMSLGLGRLTIDVSDAFQRLSDRGARILTANIVQSKVAFNFSVRTMVRAIVQYRDVRRNQALFSTEIEPKQGDILGQFLFSHKVNPQTVLFLGYSDIGLTTRSYALTRQSRTFFAKIGYAWRP